MSLSVVQGLALLIALPVYEGVASATHPDFAAAVAGRPVVVAADPAGCSPRSPAG